MIVFPNCKINLGLQILGKRSDGYHDLQTIFYPLPLTDALEITIHHSQERTSSSSTSFPFTLSGTGVQGNLTSNLCVRAYKMLKKDIPDLPRVNMHLHKVIPSGAGLGGGSADAAFTLQLLNKMFRLDLSEKKLMDYASELGSDCPFFIINKPCYATGRGELLEEMELDLSAYTFAIINPGIHIDTGIAFLNITPATPAISLKEIVQRPLERWKDDLKNDFERVIFHQYPEIAAIKDHLYDAGAEYVSMSGSGSTVFGIFRSGQNVDLSFPEHYFVRQLPGKLQ